MDYESFEVSEARIRLGEDSSWEGFTPIDKRTRVKSIGNIVEQSEEFRQEVWNAINAYKASTSPQLPYADNFVELLIEAMGMKE